MAARAKTMLAGGWRRLKNRAVHAAQLPKLVNVSQAAKSARRGLADLVFPPCCLSCLAELDVDHAPSGPHLCGGCRDGMRIFSGPMCVHCGAPIPVASPDGPAAVPPMKRGCFRCAGRKLWFDETVALGLYSDKLREIILRMKRAEGDSLSLAIGRLLLEKRGERLAEIGADV